LSLSRWVKTATGLVLLAAPPVEPDLVGFGMRARSRRHSPRHGAVQPIRAGMADATLDEQRMLDGALHRQAAQARRA